MMHPSSSIIRRIAPSNGSPDSRCQITSIAVGLQRTLCRFLARFKQANLRPTPQIAANC
jgi:hypothetical protein